MFSEVLDALLKADKALFLLINGTHNPRWDQIMVLISSTRTWIPLFAAMALSLFSQKKWNGLITLLFLVLLITLCDQVSVHGFKEVFQRLRPCHEPSMQGLVHVVNGKCGGQYGFVSSHAANSFGLIAFYLYSVNKHRKAWGIILPFYTILVSYSRVYLGVHYPGDVLVGAILGIGLGLSLAFLELKLQESNLLKRVIMRVGLKKE